jgi:hypothetical protein
LKLMRFTAAASLKPAAVIVFPRLTLSVEHRAAPPLGPMDVALTPRGPALALELVERAAQPTAAPRTSLDDRIVAALAEAGSPIQFADLR